ncbi:MAG: OmpA family protein [Acidobacteria bacterium]|nr:OmpA family protein [Acidobacteriota bacterium]
MKNTLLLLFGAVSILAQDLTDHPAVSSYPGSRLAIHRHVEFEPYEVVVSPNPDGTMRRLKLEGRVTRIRYNNPQGRSAFEIFKNYEDAMKQAGAELLYRREPRAPGNWPTYSEQKLTNMGSQGYYALVARFQHRGAETHALIAVSLPVTWIHIVEAKPLETGLVVVDAKAMEEALNRDGKIGIETIEFDTGSAEIKPESKSTIKEIAKLLMNKPNLALEIVGHTDTVGSAADNLRLSADRAKAIVTDLAGSFGISLNRLKSSGMGQSQPVAPNATPEGRKKNRRVELVAR